MFRNIFIVISVLFIFSCKTIEIPPQEEPKPTVIKEEEPPKIKIKEFGADNEVLCVTIGDKIYYVLGKNSSQNINEQNIKNISLVAPLKISEEMVKGYKGIVI